MSNYSKLKTNLKLSMERLKLLQKKKTELSHKARREIADLLAIPKVERARIRVEHIIHEDNYVEGLDILEQFCDLLLARFGLIEKMKELDPGLDEAISTLIWAAPRVMNDVQEFKVIGDLLTSKYGKNYAEACRTNKLGNVNATVMKRLGVEPPSRLLVEQYLIEIAKNFNVSYVPDSSLFLKPREVDDLINFGEQKGGGSNSAGGGSGGGNGLAESKITNAIGFDNFNIQNDQVPSANKKHDPEILPRDEEFILPVIPPPLPKNLPNTNREPSPPPPFNLDPPRFDDFDHTQKPGLPSRHFKSDDPEIVDDSNAPLPYKPGSNQTPKYTDYSVPPPSYNAKMPYPKLDAKPTAPAHTINFDDLPSVPQDNPTKGNDDNEDDDKDDDFDELNKRFQNLRKL